MSFKGPILYCFSSISHSYQRSNSSVFDMHWPKPIHGPEFQLSKSCSTELSWQQSVSVPAPLNANELHLSTPTWRGLPAYITLRERKPLTLTIACANVYGGFIAMTRRDFFVQPYHFDPESDPEGEASGEVHTLWLQQDVSEWSVCLNNDSLLVCIVTVTTI